MSFMNVFSSVQSQLRQVLIVVDFIDQLQDFVVLRLSRANLSQGMLRLKLVRAATRFVACVRSWQSACKAYK
jgi:hypothetical protein